MSVEVNPAADAVLSVRLDGVRRRARAALLVFGGSCLVLAVASGAGLAVLLDYLLHIPPSVRVVIAAVAAAGWVYVAWRFCWRALWLPMDDLLLAGKLERRFPAFADRLVSAVSFRSGPARGESPAMTRLVADEAGRLVRELPLTQSVEWKPARQALLAAASIAVLVVTVGVWQRPLASIGLRRYLHPYSAGPWPKAVTIEALTGDLIVPVGESATVRMAVRKGAAGRLRGWVSVIGGDQPQPRLLMQQVAAGQYEYTFDGVTESFRYYFEAGDDTTRDHPGRITAVKRPAVLRAQAVFYPPPYVASPRKRVVRLTEGVVRAAVGSRAAIEIELTKPVGRDAQGRPAAWLLLGRDRLAMKPLGTDGLRLGAEFELTETTYMQVHLVDESGLENRDRTPYRIEAVPDARPVVAVVEPRGTLEVTPAASVELVVSAEDDWGLTDLWVEAEVQNASAKSRLDLSDRMRFASSGPGASATAETLWQIATLKPEAGDVIAYRAKAADNFKLNAKTHPPGESAVMRLQVVSPERFAERLREEFQLLRKKIERLLSEQRDIKDEADAVRSDLSTSGQLSQADREATAALSSRQSRLGTRTRNLGRQFARTARQIQLNRIDDPEGLERLKTVGDGLRDLADRTMGGAAEDMRKAAQADQPDRQRELLGTAGQQQQQGIDGLRAFLELMDRWGNLRQVVQKVRDMLMRQQQLRSETGQIGAKTLGKPADSLTAAERAALQALRRRQRDLEQQARDLTKRIDTLAESLKKNDPASANALRDAADAARSSQVGQEMDRAAAAISENRTGEARNAQKQAEAGLRRMLDQLNKRRSRELAELAKMLHEGERALAALIEQQQRLIASNRAAQKADAAKPPWEELARRQDRTKRNAQDLAEQLARMNAAVPAGGVRRGAGKMSRAVSKLNARQPKAAEVDQKAAAEDLKRALAELRKLRQQAEQRRAQRRLAALRESLQKIRDEQQQINRQTEHYQSMREARGGLSRVAMLQVGKLAGRQEGLIKQSRGVRDRLVPAEVFVYIAQKVVEGMEASGEALEQYRTSAVVQAEQARTLQRIDQLLEALKQEDRKDQDREAFASKPTGRRNRGGQPGSALPPSAQLKLLKILQSQINQQTRRLYETRADDEKALEELRRLGHEQRSLAEMTGRLISAGRPSEAGPQP